MEDSIFSWYDFLRKIYFVKKKAVSHAKASLILAGASGSVEFAQYDDVVKYYARDLGTLIDP